MNFCWVTINVKDMDESLRFYQDVIGLKINRRMNPVPGTEIVFLKSNSNTELELIKNDKNMNPQYGNDISIGFEVETIEKAVENLKEKGVKIHSGPFQPSPIIKFLYVLDPNGLKVQLIENIKKS